MANRQSTSHLHEHETDVIFKDLSISNPFGKTLIENLNLTLPQGSTLLIQGNSGVGKTTLLRTVAGLWAYSKGDVYCPTQQLFLSQKPYLPQGSLLTALAYPNEEKVFNRDEMIEVLKQVSLGHLQDRLEQEQDWTRILSLGEQQRLAFARLLLHKPKVAFLDEATASMDEGLEDNMYRLLKERLPHTTVISVGHRSTLQAFHQQQLMILGNGEWQFTDRNLV